MDEAWLLLGHQAFREKIREWLKVLRKTNCIVLLVTQNSTDAVRSGILDVLAEATATEIFLANVYAREDEGSPFFKAPSFEHGHLWGIQLGKFEIFRLYSSREHL